MKRTMVVAAVIMSVGLVSCNFASGGMIPVTDKNVLNGLSPYNWVCSGDSINSTIAGSSITVGFKATKKVVLLVDTAHMGNIAAGRYPIIAWTVNGGAVQTSQLTQSGRRVELASGVKDPVIDLYIKGISPFENRWSGDVPANSLKVTGIEVDDGGDTRDVKLPAKVWLNIGDSIMSGDGAAYAAGQGRPPDDLWASSDDGRACYGYLLAKHFGRREARIAYGGYNWGGGMAGVPALTALIDQRTSTKSRLVDNLLKPVPDVVLINLGENGAPGDNQVTDALARLRSRTCGTTKIIVMIPVSGRGQANITRAVTSYKAKADDKNIFLVDLQKISFATCDGQHPTAAGHEAIYKAAIKSFEAIKL